MPLARLPTVATLVLGLTTAAAAQEVTFPAPDFGRYHALVIGINDYEHLPKLVTAVADADAVAVMLEKKYGIEVTKLINASRRDIVGAFNDFRRRLTEKDNLLIYFAGHGVIDIEAEQGYWLPVDARPDDDTNWFSNGRLTGYLKAMSAKHVLVVADSCYSGNLTRAVTTSLRSGAERDTWLRRMNGKRSRTALTSGGLEPVLDGGGNGNSVFAKAFLAALRENTEVLGGEMLFDRVKGPVVANTSQTPEYADIRNTDHDRGDFLFVPLDLKDPGTVHNAPPATRPDPGIFELAFWETIKDSEDPAMFEEYLKQFPEGTFAGLARLKIGRARNAAESKTALVVAPAPRGEIGPVEAARVVTKRANAREPPGVRPAKVATQAPGGTAQAAGGYPARPGASFRDCAMCPEMVVIPAGSFTMGSPASEAGRGDDEGPRHRVTIPRPFALGKYEVTRADYAAFVQETRYDARGCNVYDGKNWKNEETKGWRDPNFSQSERDPVVCVSWEDAKAYVRWLSGKTGHAYRLTNESEWEYAARAGTTTARYWGEDADRACGYANVHDRTGKSENGFAWPNHDCRDGYAKTAPVGSFRANDFGLHDMLGNVWEWIEDCYENTYDLAPRDGSAWVGGKCESRVLRGGSWDIRPWDDRAANRGRYGNGGRYSGIGFRVSKTLR